MLEPEQITRVRAVSSLHVHNGDYLSFWKGQEFYSLGVDKLRKYYFVTTEYRTPFSKTAVCGHVPIFYFVEIPLGNCWNIKYISVLMSKSVKKNIGIQVGGPCVCDKSTMTRTRINSIKQCWRRIFNK